MTFRIMSPLPRRAGAYLPLLLSEASLCLRRAAGAMRGAKPELVAHGSPLARAPREQLPHAIAAGVGALAQPLRWEAARRDSVGKAGWGGVGWGAGRALSSVAAPRLEQEEEEEGAAYEASLQNKAAQDAHCAMCGVFHSSPSATCGGGACQEEAASAAAPDVSPPVPPSVHSLGSPVADQGSLRPQEAVPELPTEDGDDSRGQGPAVEEGSARLLDKAEGRAAGAQAVRALEQCLWRVESRLRGSLAWGAGQASPPLALVAQLLQQEWGKEHQSEHVGSKGPLRPSVVHAVLTRLHDQELVGPTLAKGLLHWAREFQGVRPHVLLFTTLFSILGRAGDARGLEQAVRQMAEAGLAPDDRALCSLSSAYHALGLHSEALGVLKCPGTFFPDIHPQAQGVARGIQRAAGAQESAPAAGTGVFSACKMMDLYIRQRQFPQAWRVFQRVEASGAAVDEALCRTALVALGHMGRPRKAEALFRRMQAQWGQLAPRSWNVMMHVHSQVGEWRRVGALYEEMRRQGGTPNAWTYCILITAAGRQGHAQRPAELFREMQAQGLQPGRPEWQALIQAHACSGDVAGAKAALRAMLHAGFAFSMPAGNALLTAYCRAGMGREAQELARVMESKGYTPLVEVPGPRSGPQGGRRSKCHFRKWNLLHQQALAAEATGSAASL